MVDETRGSIFETDDPDFGYYLEETSTDDHPFITAQNRYFPGFSHDIQTIVGEVLFAYEISLEEAERLVKEIELRDRSINQERYPQDLSDGDQEGDLEHYSYLNKRLSIPPFGGYLLRLNHVETNNLSLALEIATTTAPERWGSSSYNDGDIKVGLLYSKDYHSGRVYILLGLVNVSQQENKGLVFAILDNNALPLGIQYDLFGVDRRKDEQE